MPDLDPFERCVTPPVAQSTPVGFEGMESKANAEQVLNRESPTEDGQCTEEFSAVEGDQVGAKMDGTGSDPGRSVDGGSSGNGTGTDRSSSTGRSADDGGGSGPILDGPSTSQGSGGRNGAGASDPAQTPVNEKEPDFIAQR